MTSAQPGGPDQTDYLAILSRVSRARARAVQAESDAVTAARAAGLSWDRIALATGVNRETLRKRSQHVQEEAEAG